MMGEDVRSISGQIVALAVSLTAPRGSVAVNLISMWTPVPSSWFVPRNEAF